MRPHPSKPNLTIEEGPVERRGMDGAQSLYAQLSILTKALVNQAGYTLKCSKFTLDFEGPYYSGATQAHPNQTSDTRIVPGKRVIKSGTFRSGCALPGIKLGSGLS